MDIFTLVFNRISLLPINWDAERQQKLSNKEQGSFLITLRKNNPRITFFNYNNSEEEEQQQQQEENIIFTEYDNEMYTSPKPSSESSKKNQHYLL